MFWSDKDEKSRIWFIQPWKQQVTSLSRLFHHLETWTHAEQSHSVLYVEFYNDNSIHSHYQHELSISNTAFAFSLKFAHNWDQIMFISCHQGMSSALVAMWIYQSFPILTYSLVIVYLCWMNVSTKHIRGTEFISDNKRLVYHFSHFVVITSHHCWPN